MLQNCKNYRPTLQYKGYSGYPLESRYFCLYHERKMQCITAECLITNLAATCKEVSGQVSLNSKPFCDQISKALLDAYWKTYNEWFKAVERHLTPVEPEFDVPLTNLMLVKCPVAAF